MGQGEASIGPMALTPYQRTVFSLGAGKVIFANTVAGKTNGIWLNSIFICDFRTALKNKIGLFVPEIYAIF